VAYKIVCAFTNIAYDLNNKGDTSNITNHLELLYAIEKEHNAKMLFDTSQCNEGSDGNMKFKAFRNLIFVTLTLILKYCCKYFKPFLNWASLLLDDWEKSLPLNGSFIRGQQKYCGDCFLFIMHKISG
jgi:hypothetical protein